jgi:transcriptional regulator with XRE-family HTH domain
MLVNDALAANIRSMRARKRLQQADVSDRVSALGYKWTRQTVSEIERCERRLLAEEVYALALVLETTIGSLMDMPGDVLFPNGHRVLNGTPG